MLTDYIIMCFVCSHGTKLAELKKTEWGKIIKVLLSMQIWDYWHFHLILHACECITEDVEAIISLKNSSH